MSESHNSKPITWSFAIGAGGKRGGAAKSISEALLISTEEAAKYVTRSLMSTVARDAPMVYQLLAEYILQLLINYYMTPYGRGLESEDVGVWTGSFLKSLKYDVATFAEDKSVHADISVYFNPSDERKEHSSLVDALSYYNITVSEGTNVGVYGHILMSRLAEKDFMDFDDEFSIQNVMSEHVRDLVRQSAVNEWLYRGKSLERNGPYRSPVLRNIERRIAELRANNNQMIEIAAERRLHRAIVKANEDAVANGRKGGRPRKKK